MSEDRAAVHDRNRLEEDLGYVRDAVSRMERHRSPAPIYFLWAAICLVGFALVDFAPRALAGYWMVATPAGFIASVVIGWRAARRAGQLHRAGGDRHVLHWLGLMVAIGLSIVPAARGEIAWSLFAANVVLLLALAYWLSGVHLDRPMRWIGLLLAGGYCVILLAPGPAWTVVGALVAAALCAAGWVARTGPVADAP